jgi:hypothetical protein
VIVVVALAAPAGAVPFQRVTGPAQTALGEPVVDPTCPPSVARPDIASRRQRVTATVTAASGTEVLVVDACLINSDNTRGEDVGGTFTLTLANGHRHLVGSVTGQLVLPPAPPWCAFYIFILTLHPDHGQHDLFFDAPFGGPFPTAFLATSAQAASDNIVECGPPPV